MGYTHYFSIVDDISEDQFFQFVEDTEVIICTSDVPIADGLGEEEHNYTCINDAVCFNGLSPNHCETFALSREKCEHFCKTQRFPYDEVVTAVLISAKHTFGDKFKVSSDGNDFDWKAGRELCQRALGYGENFTLTKSGGGWKEESEPVWFNGEEE